MLAVESLRKTFSKAVVLDGLTFSLEPRSITCLSGLSGSGKTTLLKAIAGLVDLDGGSIMIGGCDVTNVPPARRSVDLAFQHGGLLSHMTAAQNILLGVQKHIRTAQISVKFCVFNEALEAAHVDRRVLDQYPETLSGGEIRRVSLARAYAARPTLLLLDEPLAGVDSPLKSAMLDDIRQVHEMLGCTTLMVSHDIDDGKRLGAKMYEFSPNALIPRE